MSKFKVGDRVRVPGDVAVCTVTGLWGDLYSVVSPSGEEEDYRENELRPADIHPQESDPVSKPTHYSQGMPEGIEVIDVIRAQDAGFEHANVIKYILRYKYKNGVEDLKKAQQYLQWLIEKEEENK